MAFATLTSFEKSWLPQGDGCPHPPGHVPLSEDTSQDQEEAETEVLDRDISGTSTSCRVSSLLLPSLSLLQGAKLFYLSGLIHGHYPKVEIHNLGRFISVMKFRPLEWRSSHAHILADRVEDLTDPEAVRVNHKCSRTVSLYGFIRGTHLKPGSAVHIPGESRVKG